MAFKEAHTQFQMIAVTLIEPDTASPRQNIDETALKSLANSIRKMGVIHPLLVQPANSAGLHTLIVGERRWRAAVMAGEQSVPALIRCCEAAEVLDVQVSENMGLGVRSALEPRDMANAIQTIAERFDNREAAAEHFGGTRAWLNQATAAATANLSPKITALLNSGKIPSAGTAIQLEKLSQKNEARAESLIGHVEKLPEGEKLTRKTVDRALSEEGGRRKKREEITPEAATSTVTLENAVAIPLSGEAPADLSISRGRINPGKVARVARILGLPDGDETEVLVRLIDEYLALKEEGSPPF
ncbi:MAG: ParB/RepB/Spo0J family partition protein [Gallionella sp.]|nr:ParB/RepB/Spo0J family partition protein [Gallionella sp.]